MLTSATFGVGGISDARWRDSLGSDTVNFLVFLGKKEKKY